MPADHLVTFASLGHVRRIKRVLERDAGYYEIQRTPHALAVGGCGFALRCQREQLAEVLRVAHEQRIAIGGLYRECATEEPPAYEPLDALSA